METENEGNGQKSHVSMSAIAMVPLGKDRTAEKEFLLQSKSTSLAREVCWRWAAIAVSWLSVIFSLVTGVLAVVLGVSDNSQALLAYGLEALLDAISSLAVLWRFHGDVDGDNGSRRERLACIVISSLFLVAAISLIARSIQSLVDVTRGKESRYLYVISIVDGVVAMVLAVTKLLLGLKLTSRALITDSLITFTGALTSFGTVMALTLYESHPNLWYLDDVVATVCGIFLLSYGTRYGEACNHVSALLFALEDITNKKADGTLATTSQQCKWAKPRDRKLTPERPENMTFRKFDWQDNSEARNPSSFTSDYKSMTQNEQVLDVNDFRAKLVLSNPNAAWMLNF